MVRVILPTILAAAMASNAAMAIGPADIAVIYNANVPVSRSVAEYYCKKRAVPVENLIALNLPDVEELSRADYENLMMAPLRSALRNRRPAIRVLLTVYGVPLRIGPKKPTDRDNAALDKARPQLDEARAQVQKLTLGVNFLKNDIAKDPKSALAEVLPEREAELKVAQQKVQILEEQVRVFSQSESTACVDSELMLLWWPDYPLSRWVFNPLYWQVPEHRRRESPPVLMTCRLDGPSADIAKRIVDDAMFAEQKGLQGKAYIDARGIKFDPKADAVGTGYGGYDESYREAARMLKLMAKMEVFLEDTEELFPVGGCTECALYSGWYALKNYRPCCQFVRGAIAWHLASLEATSLRHPNKEWAGNLLRDGAAVTIGPVAEPYTIGFPKPEEFFGFVVSGEFTLVECYARSTLLTSWMMVLVGDPLYRPFAKTPKMKASDVLPSPHGAVRLFHP